MRLSLKSKVRVALNFVPFLVFSHFYEKDLKAKAKAEGLTFEEYKKKYFTLDNSDGKISKQFSMFKAS